WASLLSLKAIRSWDQPLPDTRDMQTHQAEVKLDALPIGEYILIASTDRSFSLKKGILGSRVFFISNISFVNSGRNYFVLNRDNGRPLERADVQVWEQKYDYKTSKYVKQKFGTYATDKNGYFALALPKEQPYGSHNYNLEIRHGGDHLDMNEFLDDYYYHPGSNATVPALSIFLFSDRSLYRPGQTVFFKGIALDKNPAAKTANIRAGLETTVYLTNPNSQRVDSIKVKTNEFGSFSGKFQLPAGTLNGQFSIGTFSETQIAIQVEEYKRPKFYVEYEPLKGTYQVNELVKVTGVAKAYAGNTIDGATVTYRVVRQPRFLYPWMFWRGWYPPTPPMEIAHGQATTDKDGKFIIEFTAIPDLSIERKLDPVFDYKVYADVTDINGETRSAEKVVSVSYKSLLLKVMMKEKIATDSLNKIFIRTENMSGEYAPAVARVVISRLKEEKRLIRPRLWERPDQFVMSKEEYIRHFPLDEYANESDPKSWEKGEKVFEKTDSVRSNGEWALTGSNYQPGYYVVEIFTKDKNGEEVKDVRYVELYDRRSNKLNIPEYLWTEAIGPLAPGQSGMVQLGTSADNLFVIKQVDKGTGDSQENKSNFSFLSLNNEKRAVDVSASEADRGGFGIAFLFVKHNRFFQFSQAVEVPWTNKILGIEFATYRDKALPGSAERWKIRLTGPGNEKLAAEMLASMYDASLDQFYGHHWSIPGIWPVYANRLAWNGSKNFASVQAMIEQHEDEEYKSVDKRYDVLLTSINPYDGNIYGGRGNRYYKMAAGAPPVAQDSRAESEEGYRRVGAVSVEALGNTSGQADSTAVETRTSASDKEQQARRDDPAVQIRKNFNETVFFFPELRTDSSGAIEFSFTLPDALTRWKFQAIAHTKDLAFGYASKEIITQKQLMVQPNAPRFLREGDKIVFSAKIVNLAEDEMSGQAELQLFDAATNQPVNAGFNHSAVTKPFKVTAGQSAVVVFPLEIPSSFSSALVWKIVAKATKSGANQQEAFSDGEENVLPVLSNRMLVTETVPMHLRGTGTKTFSFDKLLQSGNSSTLKNHTLTIEYTSNPSWYAVQALPYLMEYPYDCAEQIWNRYYANSIATMIVNSAPRLKQIFEQWKTKDTAALLSNLQKNEELKSVLLEETPWVLQAKTEAEQKRNIALLFDMVHMSGQLNGSFQKLIEMQSSNGGFVWFKGGPDDRYMTQYIVTGIGHLRKLNAQANGQEPKLKQILARAIPYLDQKMAKDYADLVKSKADLAKQTPGSYVIQYLYMRSFFPEYKIQASVQTAYNYYRGRAQKTWTQQSKYMQGMLTLALGRTGDAATPAAILKSLKETSINNEELGMYWKDTNRGWWWYELPIERQALLIEAFHEIGKDTRTVDDLRTWLLKNKQTNNWESTKATAEACYALLLTGSSWTTAEPTVRVQLGNTTVSSADNKLEAGTGYFKKTIEGSAITPSMGNISLSLSPINTSNSGSTTTGPSWGAVYWQYFEDIDKITTAATPLQLSKKLFVETVSDRGPVLTPVNNGASLKVGDKIKVRIELRVDRDMEYVHMKDMRAAAMEPVNVLSGYKWQGGLGYYETTRDASTNFFFNLLRKGTYVFEYTLFVTHAGDFSNGITTIQSMYAPEFSSHSEGIRVKIN
ncbi:MAG: alpha-2-macroglobulin, partial [Chitinophagaceae bacterium]|nr:alpha-2-macroglobulin [Chitinophagaceae bacterium]